MMEGDVRGKNSFLYKLGTFLTSHLTFSFTYRGSKLINTFKWIWSNSSSSSIVIVESATMHCTMSEKYFYGTLLSAKEKRI